MLIELCDGVLMLATAKHVDATPLPASAPSSIVEVLSVAAAGYEPQPCNQRIVYLQAADQPIALPLGSRLGWADLAKGGFDVYVVPGDHVTLLDPPYAAAVAEALGGLLTCDTQSQPRAAAAAYEGFAEYKTAGSSAKG